MTHCKLIEDHIKKYGSITSWEAILNYHITRLSARIYDLKNRKKNPLFLKAILMKNKETGVQYVKYVLDNKNRRTRCGRNN